MVALNSSGAEIMIEDARYAMCCSYCSFRDARNIRALSNRSWAGRGPVATVEQ